MFPETDKYQNNGHFFFKKGDDLQKVGNNVAGKPGVYYIFKLAHDKIKLVYLGKSGIMQQNGTFKNQTLREQLSNDQNGGGLQEFLDKKFQEESIAAFDIYWFVTFDNDHRDLPGYVEGLLMQHHFVVYGQLPDYNIEF